MNRRLLPALLFSSLPVSVIAGDFSVSRFTGDGDSGISSALTYTARADLQGTGTQTINGVSFAETGTSGTNYTLGGTGGAFTGFGNNLTGSSNGAISNFVYTGDGSGNATVTLSGLTAGQSYVTSWHNAAFGGPGGRVVTITPSDTSLPFTFDQNYTGAGNGSVLRYTFVATGPSITYSFDAASNGDSFHHYLLTNAVRNNAVLATPIISSASGAGPFAPYTPSSTDLLQTSLAGTSSSGTFNLEGTGGTPVLNNGAFSITGVGGNNPELATVQNDSWIVFDLNVAAAPSGYDISGIDTYGGWNDAGRDRQNYKISYSLVGSSDYVYLGAMDHDPAAGATPSAVRAQFQTNLTGVDSLRFEFFNSQENGHAGLGEIDVFGTATVPEPGLSALLALSGLLALRRRR